MRTAISGLIIAAALSASPVFAASNDCVVNLQRARDAITSAGTIAEPANSQVMSAQTAAQAAMQQGNDRDCIAASLRVMQILEDAKEVKN